MMLVLLFLISCRYTGNDKNTYHTLLYHSETNVLKFIMTIGVLLHHISLQIWDYSHYELVLLGGICVGVFFMLSAYGITKQYIYFFKTKNEMVYCKKIFYNKIPKLYCFSVFMNSIYILYEMIILKYPFKSRYILQLFHLDFFISLDSINPYSWFIIVIIIMYSIFALSIFIVSFLQKEQHTKLLVICISIFFIIMYIVLLSVHNMNQLYMRGIIGFIIGLVLAFFEEKILNFIFYTSWLPISLITIFITLFGFSYYYLPTIFNNSWVLSENLLVCLFCLILIAFISVFKLQNNFFSKCSKFNLDIYFWQGLILIILPYDQFIQNSAIYFITIVIITCLVSIISYYIRKIIMYYIKDLKTKRKGKCL